jgi:hypothetical protein
VCGSTSRDKLTNVVVAATAGSYEGKPYSHVKRSRTKCRGCGQRYVVIDYLRPSEPKRYAKRTKPEQSSDESRTAESENS